jgi:hypothetical protein
MNFSESGGFYPDGRALLITTAALTHNFWNNQIARVDLDSGAITALTPGSYNEHPRFTRDGHIMWMTNTDNKQGTDWWWMLPDGTGAERLTRFNESDSQGGGTSAVWTGAVPVDNGSDDGSWFLGDVETNLLTAAGEIRRIQLTCE